MKRIFIIIALTVLVWGCAKKISPSASSVGTGAPNTGAPAVAPSLSSKTESTSANSTATAVTPAYTTDKATKVPVDVTKAPAPELLGQSTFNAKCSRCHGLKVTTNYTADRWVSIMQVMASKANLTEVEKENVLAFVKANAKK